MTIPWRGTTPEIASESDSRYETPGGAQNKIDTSYALMLNILKLAVTGLSNGSEAAIARFSTPYGITYDWLVDRLDASDQRIKNKNEFNVKDFGAKGNYANDDTTSIQNAIDAAHSSGGGEVIFPKGSYSISSPLHVPEGVTLIGNYTLSEIYASSIMDAVINLYGSIRSLRINGNNKASKGLKLMVDYVYLERVVVEYCIYGIYNDGHDVHRFINCSTQNNTYGIYSADRLINCFFYGLTSQNNTYGFYVTYSAQQPQSIFFDHCLFFGDDYGIVFEKDVFVLDIGNSVFDSISNRAIWLKPLTSHMGDDITIHHCYIGAAEVPIFIGEGYGHIVIDSNHRIDNGSYYGIVISATASLRNQFIVISNNSLGNNGGGDISVDSPDGCIIKRNRFGSASGTNISTIGSFAGNKPMIIVKENYFTKSNPVSVYNTLVTDNYGYVTNNRKSSILPSGSTQVTADHGLSVTPTCIFLTPKGNVGSTWVSNITSTSFTINSSVAPGSNVEISWEAYLL